MKIGNKQKRVSHKETAAGGGDSRRLVNITGGGVVRFWRGGALRSHIRKGTGKGELGQFKRSP